MAEFIQSIILSDITLFLIIGLMMALITSWAFSMREYAGYLLGWLVGFLLILLISTFFVGQPEEPITSAQLYLGPAMFVGLVVSSVIGLVVGSVSLLVVQVGSEGRSRVVRALIVAVATSFTLASGYLMILASFSFRLTIAAFVLAVAIGGLFNYILMRQRARSAVVSDAEVFADANGSENGLARPSQPVIITDDLPSPLAQRIHSLRQRVRRFDE